MSDEKMSDEKMSDEKISEFPTLINIIELLTVGHHCSTGWNVPNLGSVYMGSH